MRKKKLSREAIARLEIGSTDISGGGATMLTVCFVLLIVMVPLVQLALDKGESFGSFFRLQLIEPMVVSPEIRQSSVIARVNRGSKTILKNIDQLESRLEEDSFLRQIFLPPMQYLFIRYLGKGNEKVISGEDDYLFYSVAVDYLVGQPFLASEQLLKRSDSNEIWQVPVQPDPLLAIEHFKEQLALLDIELLLVPVPVKGSIEPENLTQASYTRPVRNRSWQRFMAELEARKIKVFDPGPTLVEYSQSYGGAFLQDDTHWLPGAMERVAEKLAEYIKITYSPQAEKIAQQLSEEEVVASGDITTMLTLPEWAGLFSKQKVIVRQVLSDRDEYWQGDENSDILLLGDSFTNMYSFSGLGWGFAAGFAEHLSFRLQQPIDRIAQNDSGAYATRELLARELSRGRDRLADKKLVIWEFSERELASGDWKIVDLKLNEPKESGFFLAEPGEQYRISGVVASISVSPRPGSVPYTDNIVTLHLLDLKDETGETMVLHQAVVYGWGMRGNRLMAFAEIRAGDEIELKLSSWDDLEEEYGGYRRTPLEDEMLELELPNWGKLVDE